MGGVHRTTRLLRHYPPHRKLSGPAQSSLSPGSAGLGRQAMRSLLPAQKFNFFGWVCTKNSLQPPRLCSPNPRFILFNQLRLFPDVIALRCYFPHMNVVSYPSGIMTHFSFQEQASVACSWVDIGAAGSLCLHSPGSTSDAAQRRNPNAGAEWVRCLF